MRTPDAVASHLFQDFQLAFHGTHIDRRSQASQIVMHAYPVYLHRSSVKDKSLFGIKRKRS